MPLTSLPSEAPRKATEQLQTAVGTLTPTHAHSKLNQTRAP